MLVEKNLKQNQQKEFDAKRKILDEDSKKHSEKDESLLLVIKNKSQDVINGLENETKRIEEKISMYEMEYQDIGMRGDEVKIINDLNKKVKDGIKSIVDVYTTFIDVINGVLMRSSSMNSIFSCKSAKISPLKSERKGKILTPQLNE